MNTVVNRLLDVDRDARQMLDEARQYYERTLKELADEKKKMREGYAEKARLHLQELQSEQQGEVDDVIAGVRERTAALINAMETRYNQNHTQWEDELFRRVIGRGAP